MWRSQVSTSTLGTVIEHMLDDIENRNLGLLPVTATGTTATDNNNDNFIPLQLLILLLLYYYYLYYYCC